MKKCPYCAESIQEEAIKCRYCGEFLDGRPTGQASVIPPMFWGYEYRSEMEIGGWPLIHIASGIDPATGRPRIAKGIIAIGNIAIGGLAIGGLAMGGLTMGGVSLGVGALGGLAIGIIAAVGGAALGGMVAVGGLAISFAYALGGLGIAPHVIDANGADPEMIRKLERLFGKQF